MPRRTIQPSDKIGQEIAKAKKAKRSKPTRGGDQRSKPSPPAGPTQWQPSARDLEIYSLYSEGSGTERELAERYELSKTTVHEVIHNVERYLAAKYMVEIRELRARVTERMELIYAKAMQSYAQSCEDAVTITVTKGGGKDGNEEITRQEVKGQSGNPAMLAQAREAMAEVMKIWGAYAPKVHKVEINKAVRVAGKSPEQALTDRIQHLQGLLARHTTPHAN